MRPTKLANFEGITKDHNVNIMLFESKKDRMQDLYGGQSMARLSRKHGLPTTNMGLLGGHCFYIKKMYVIRWGIHV